MGRQGMDVHRNVDVTGDLAGGSQPQTGLSTVASTLDYSFPENIPEGDEDVSLEWLSIFVEDCLSSTPSYTSEHLSIPTTTTTAPQISQPPPSQNLKPSYQELESPSKPKSKRRRTTSQRSYPQSHDPQCHTLHVTPSDPPLLHQTHWLADSELFFPKKEQEDKPPEVGREAEEEKVEEKEGEMVQPRRCSHCLSQRTPQWRAGPLGPKTLCNACGVRFKSGRLLPEYRPAKSPTFVSYKHSNSHKKVMEMRMTVLSSDTN